MRKFFWLFPILLAILHLNAARAQSKLSSPADLVNVFLGTSGDHGQLSPAAAYPFSMLSILPQTYPSIHTGYEYYAKKFIGFAHSCFEGVGCQGSGANLLVKPFIGENPATCDLIRKNQTGSPGFYSVAFENGIDAAFTVGRREGIHVYHYPVSGETGNRRQNGKGLYFDLSHSRANGFVAEKHTYDDKSLSGWIQSGTTCSVGKYKIYYHIVFDKPVKWDSAGDHRLIARLPENTEALELRIGWSSTDASYAEAAVDDKSFAAVRSETRQAWNDALGRIQITPSTGTGNVGGGKAALKEEAKLHPHAALFYSMLYRAIQSPYEISEPDGSYRTTNGKLVKSGRPQYSGWSVWDNYRTQLPLLSLVYSNRYSDIANSLAALYQNGKKDYATQNEPTNTVRTEHAVVVLLDAIRKGYKVDLIPIIDSIKKEVDGLDFSHPDKALESSYDTWALSALYDQLKRPELSRQYRDKALQYKKYWKADFSDLHKKDVDRMQARGMYQGTIWQYRWLVPYDMKGLIELAGGEAAFEKQLDTFFDNDYYSQANEPDIEAPSLYNVTNAAWKSQALMQRYALDTVVQYYFNDNSRGIDPVVGPVYQNQPRAFLRTMDDDGGAMSSWFVFAASGLFPACVGQPVYYLSVPFFERLKMATGNGKEFEIRVRNFAPGHVYIDKVLLNGKQLHQNYLTQAQIGQGGSLVIVASANPNKRFPEKRWISAID